MARVDFPEREPYQPRLPLFLLLRAAEHDLRAPWPRLSWTMMLLHGAARPRGAR